MRTAFSRPPLVVLCATGLGIIAWLADRVSSDSALPMASGLGNLPSHWLATAFFIGVIARGKLTGATFAAIGLAIAVLVYYGAIGISGDREGIDLTNATRAWLVVAIAAGPVFGLAGATWLLGPAIQRPPAVALLCGALAGEALYLVDELDTFASFTIRDTSTVFALLEFGVAGALPFMMLRETLERTVALAGAFVCAIVMYFSITAVMDGIQGFISPF